VAAETTRAHTAAGFSWEAFEALLEAIGGDASRRDRERIPPYEEIRLLAEAGFGAVRVPAAYGGPGATLRELFGAVIALAAADSNIAQSLRAHFHFVEARLAGGDEDARRRWLAEVLGGALFGQGTVERSTIDIFGFETTLTPNGDGHILSGTKYYSTGSLYCDWVSVAAKAPDGTTVSAIVPADREGVFLDDDWDGMGQRLTASGTSRFEDVRVGEHEVLPSPIGAPAAAPRSAFLQLYLVAVMAGIAREVAVDAAAVVRARTRTFSHASGETAREDPLIQQVVGQISSNAFAAETVVLAAADAFDRAAPARPGAPTDPDLVHEAALRTAQAQVVVSELAPRSAELLFHVGGASATTREANLDRHWRNARTIASHNPAMYKARAIGDLLVNEQRLPTNGFF
jgi:alkylation response protein AidB-like acyl-CoA dehydrogenase